VIDSVAQAYNSDPEREWNRLKRDAYRALEFDITWDALVRRLPRGAHVLDAGGGPGRYSLALCRAGYRVTLFDLTSGLLNRASEAFQNEPEAVRSRLEGIEQGDLRDLSRFSSERFDGVICLGGPLSHIPSADGRLRAVTDMARVTRTGGWVFLTGVGKLGVMRYLLDDQSEELLPEVFEPFFTSGDLTGMTGTTWHFFRAGELRDLGESCGLATVEMLGCQ
jgi:SAM-dependent methyltransferase